MSGNRKAVEAKLLSRIHSLTPNSTKNRDLYAARFKGMTDKDFSDFIDRLESEEEILRIFTPNLSGDGLSLQNNFKVADSMGHNFYQRLWVRGKHGLPDHLTPIEYMVVDLPTRRASQTSEKKISVPKNSKTINVITGQVTGESKGARLSGIELKILAAMGLEDPLIELMKYRGGDGMGRAALNGMLIRYGKASLRTLSAYASGVESTATVKTMLLSAMLLNNA